MRRTPVIDRPASADSGGSKVFIVTMPGESADSIVAPASARLQAAGGDLDLGQLGHQANLLQGASPFSPRADRERFMEQTEGRSSMGTAAVILLIVAAIVVLALVALASQRRRRAERSAGVRRPDSHRADARLHKTRAEREQAGAEEQAARARRQAAEAEERAQRAQMERRARRGVRPART